jgi:hypothetical protein
VRSTIDHAKAAAASGQPDPAKDFLPLLDALATATKREDQDDLLNSLRDIGAYDSPRSRHQRNIGKFALCRQYRIFLLKLHAVFWNA